MEKYQDRRQAGQQLAAALKDYAKRSDAIVLALPRGGVPVAFEVATALQLPLDVFLVRKLGVPGYKELAMGAIAFGGVQIVNEKVIADQQISDAAFNEVLQTELSELNRRQSAYRGSRPPLELNNKLVILVDDGIATGATMRAAVKALRELNPSFIVVAVPVADALIADKMKLIADKVICPMQPTYFSAVGAYYTDFAQTDDNEVIHLLAQNSQ